MKLVQANIWGGRLDKVIPTFLSREQADIVCLQETIDTNGDAALAMPVDKIAQAADFPHLFHSPVFSFGLMGRMAHFGNAILSKQPFVETDTIFTNLEYKADFDYDADDYNIRNLQHAIIKLDGTELHVLNHHGHHIPSHKDGDAETLRQMKQIAEYTKTLEGPVILCGDFNLAPHSESLELLNSILMNLSVGHHLKTTRTQFTHKTEVCDYIFVNDQVRVRSFHASDNIISDHTALVLEFTL